MLYIASVRPDSETAGLSPMGNKRTEVFFAGCKKAREGHPCTGCFNQALWHTEGYQYLPCGEVFADIQEAGNKYVTLVGGEPLDQYGACIELMEKLRNNGYHTVMITHYTMDQLMLYFPRVLDYANVIIDGEYDPEKRIFDTDKTPGIYHVIGSSNQQIWFRDKDNRWRSYQKDRDDLADIYSRI